MADTVNIQTIYETPRRIVLQLTNISDATGESAVNKLDISTKTGPTGGTCTKVVLEEATWDVKGGSVGLFFDHTTDDEILQMGGAGYVSYIGFGGLQDPGSSGGTGDILLTTNGFVANSSYNITLAFRKKD